MNKFDSGSEMNLLNVMIFGQVSVDFECFRYLDWDSKSKFCTTFAKQHKNSLKLWGFDSEHHENNVCKN